MRSTSMASHGSLCSTHWTVSSECQQHACRMQWLHKPSNAGHSRRWLACWDARQDSGPYMHTSLIGCGPLVCTSGTALHSSCTFGGRSLCPASRMRLLVGAGKVVCLLTHQQGITQTSSAKISSAMLSLRRCLQPYDIRLHLIACVPPLQLRHCGHPDIRTS